MEPLLTKKTSARSRLDITVLTLGLIATLLMLWVVSNHQGSWPGYRDMVTALPHPAAWLRWVTGDISEVAFYKHELASLGLLSGAYLAWWASRQGKAWQGFSISYGTGLWPWLVTSSLIGLLLSNLLWGWSVTADTWQPTFAAFVSLPAAMVLMFGGGWKVTLNGAVLGALLVTPMCLLIVNLVCVRQRAGHGNRERPCIHTVPSGALAGAFELHRPREAGPCCACSLWFGLERASSAGRLFRSAIFRQ